MLVYGSEGRPFFSRLTAGREDELHYVLARRLGAPAAPLDDYVAAEETVERLRADATRFFAGYDLLLLPTVPVPAPHHELPALRVNGEELHPRAIMRATLPWDLTGQPALALPWGFDGDGIPVGVQLVGRRLDDATVLHAGVALDALRPARDERPDI
jgi:aspartyl-tRNA(Asn)/glutamyl-tRNA(Gln) amidotransferase subunit A